MTGLARTAPAEALRAARSTATLLARQTAPRAVLAACLLGPWLFAVLVAASGVSPSDTLMGRWVHESASAVPLVVEAFAAQWVLPAVAAVAGGFAFGTAYQHRLWDALLTRGVRRGSVLAGVTAAALVLTGTAVLVLAASSLLAGLPAGSRLLVGLDGSTLVPAAATRVAVVAWLVAVPPALVCAAAGALAAVVTRSLVGGVSVPVLLGLAAQLPSLVDVPAPVRRLLPTTAYTAWHSVATATPDWGPVWRGTVVSLAYVTVLVVATSAVFLRQDVR